MNPWTTLAGLLRQLPSSIRRTLYTVVSAAGAVLAIAQIAGWKSIGPIDLDTAMQTYALISSPTGFLALANVKPAEDQPAPSPGYDRYDDRDAGDDDRDDDPWYDPGYDDASADRPAYASSGADESSFS